MGVGGVGWGVSSPGYGIFLEPMNVTDLGRGSVSLVCLSPIRWSAAPWTLRLSWSRGTFVHTGGQGGGTGQGMAADRQGALPPVNAGGFQCLFGETVGVNVQRGIDRVRPSGPGTVRVWNAQPYEGEVGVRGSPAPGECGCEAQLGPWAYSNHCRLFSGVDVYPAYKIQCL